MEKDVLFEGSSSIRQIVLRKKYLARLKNKHHRDVRYYLFCTQRRNLDLVKNLAAIFHLEPKKRTFKNLGKFWRKAQ